MKQRGNNILKNSVLQSTPFSSKISPKNIQFCKVATSSSFYNAGSVGGGAAIPGWVLAAMAGGDKGGSRGRPRTVTVLAAS